MLKILYQDKKITVCEKLPGMVSEKNDSPDSLPMLLEKQLGHEVFPLHRLDKPVGGAIMFANDKKSASEYSRLIAENKIKKTYMAVIDGITTEATGKLQDYLYRDAKKNKTYTVKKLRKGVKKAELEYETLKSTADHSLIKIKLLTGRTHQIRVQFASRKTPVTGDGKYGSKNNKCEAALWSYALSFTSPDSGEPISIESTPPFNSYPWNIFKT